MIIQVALPSTMSIDGLFMFYEMMFKINILLFQELDIDYNVNSELKKLQFYGAGPKAAVPGQGGILYFVNLSCYCSDILSSN